jgi:hypothetical protein
MKKAAQVCGLISAGSLLVAIVFFIGARQADQAYSTTWDALVVLVYLAALVGVVIGPLGDCALAITVRRRQLVVRLLRQQRRERIGSRGVESMPDRRRERREAAYGRRRPRCRPAQSSTSTAPTP